MGTRECRCRDWLSLILGLLLVFTIVLIPVAMALLRAGSYKLRTVVEIGVEGEAYRYRYGNTGPDMTEWLDVVSEARVTLRVTTGVAEGESDISRPSRVRGERRRTAREQDYLRDAFEQRLISLALPVL